jgi:hypothetical protein
MEQRKKLPVLDLGKLATNFPHGHELRHGEGRRHRLEDRLREVLVEGEQASRSGRRHGVSGGALQKVLGQLLLEVQSLLDLRTGEIRVEVYDPRLVEPVLRRGRKGPGLDARADDVR